MALEWMDTLKSFKTPESQMEREKHSELTINAVSN